MISFSLGEGALFNYFTSQFMETSSLTVIVPKSGIAKTDGRNSNLTNLFVNAGYDKVLGGFNRQDVFEQDDIRFLGIKDAPTLSSQFRNSTNGMGVIMGLDVLMEADFSSRRDGVRFDIRKLLDTGIGACSMRVLAPEESPISSPQDFQNRTVFTKYPHVFRRLLRSWKQMANVEYVTGSEIRANENRTSRVAAFEIVESGNSARENRLAIARDLPYPSGLEMGVPYAEIPMNIATNIYAGNIDRLSEYQRGKLMALGLALESSLKRNTYVSFTFMVPTSRSQDFSGFGMKGPTVSRVLSDAVEEWSALEICVPEAQMNDVRLQLIERGAEGIVTKSGLQSEPDPKSSQVLAAIDAGPIDLRAETAPVDEALFLLSLNEIILQKANSGDQASGTFKALSKGAEACASKCGEEVLELSEALMRSDSASATLEAGDVLYRFFVALRTRTLGIQDILPVPSNDDSIRERFAEILSCLDRGEAASSDVLFSMQARWNICSTAIRKKELGDVRDSAAEFLRAFSRTLSAFDISLSEVVSELKRKHALMRTSE